MKKRLITEITCEDRLYLAEALLETLNKIERYTY